MQQQQSKLQQSEATLRGISDKIKDSDYKESLVMIQELLNENSQHYQQSQSFQLTYAILQIKNENSKTALEILNGIQKPIQSHLVQSFSQARLYANYRLGNYSIVIKELRESVVEQVYDKMLLAQCLGKSEQYSEMIDIYVKLLQSSNNQEEIIANILSGGICVENTQQMDRVNKIVSDYVKRQKGQVSIEIMLNQAILFIMLKEYNQSRDTTNRLINLIKLDSASSGIDLEQNEDYIMSQLILDYIDLKQDRMSASLQESKIKWYTTLSQNLTVNEHLRAVALNNLAILQETMHHNNSETLRRIEESLEILQKGKSTPQQLSILRINRIILQYSRNRFLDAIKNFKEIELKINDPFILSLLRLIQALKSNHDFSSILQETFKLAPDQLSIVFVVLIVINEQPQIITQLIRDTVRIFCPQWATFKPLVLLALAAMQKNSDSKQRELLQEIETNGHLVDLAQYYLNTHQIDEAIRIHQLLEKSNHPSSEFIHGRIALKFIEQDQWDKAEGYLDLIPFPFQLIDDNMELERLEINVQLTKQTQSQSQSQQQLVKSQDLQQVTQKIVKNKKKRSRRSKMNLPLDAPPPNPERWLPKFERKDYRKRKGQQMKSRTQGSATQVGNKEQMSVFVKGATSANVDVAQKQSKNKKKKH